jgi:hypothetical protein
MVLLKLDFEKAFDKVEHEVIVQVMKHILSRKIDAVDSRDFKFRNFICSTQWYS